MRGKRSREATETYLVAKTFAACDFARAAALRWTTPDLTALSIAELYSEAAALLPSASLAEISASRRLRRVLRRVLTPWLRSWRRADLRAALMADFVLAMVD